MNLFSLIALLVPFFGFVFADLTPHFRNFLNARFGAKSANRFARNDMGISAGSFGGRRDDNDVVQNHPNLNWRHFIKVGTKFGLTFITTQDELIGANLNLAQNTRPYTLEIKPVVFVHGLTLRAGTFFSHRAYFIQQGYSQSELYATTYSDGGITPFFSKTMNCEDVKQIREFIKAVYLYTNKTVDVLAYSMGVAVSRKAILGGRCVDTNEYLGGSITRLINTYVAVAGVAYGYQNCPKQFKICEIDIKPEINFFLACNAVNGMACDSKYIKDVNSKAAPYEGMTTYALYSVDDFLVGQHCCDNICSMLKNANGTVVEQGYDHLAIFFYTKEKQLALLRNEIEALNNDDNLDSSQANY